MKCWTTHGDHRGLCLIVKLLEVYHHGCFQYLPTHYYNYMAPKNAILMCFPDDSDLIDLSWDLDKNVWKMLMFPSSYITLFLPTSESSWVTLSFILLIFSWRKQRRIQDSFMCLVSANQYWIYTYLFWLSRSIEIRIAMWYLYFPDHWSTVCNGQVVKSTWSLNDG